MNILIVDDIAINRKLLRAMLEAEGHAAIEAADGVEALLVLQSTQVDALMSDILMPRMDGYRLCHEVRSTEGLHDLPIVIYTSTYTSASDEKLAFDVGADKYLKKPSPVGVILTALHQAIAMEHRVPRYDASQEVEVLKEYSDRLVAKLEEKNIELEERVRLTGLSGDVTAAIMHQDTLQLILQSCCEAVVQHLDAAIAASGRLVSRRTYWSCRPARGWTPTLMDSTAECWSANSQSATSRRSENRISPIPSSAIHSSPNKSGLAGKG